MNKRLQEILARKEEIRSLMKADEPCDFDAIEQELDALEAEERNIIRKLEVANRLNDESLRGRIVLPPGVKTEPEREQRNEIDTSSMEYRAAFKEYVTHGTPLPAEFRADATTTTTGAPIPMTLLNTIIEKMVASGMILPLITQTNYRGGLSIPTSNVKPQAVWVAESAGSEKQAKTTGSIIFGYYKLRCAVAVSLEVDTMAIPAFEAVLVNNVAQAMVLGLEQAIISGTGVAQPTGIISAGTTVNAGQAITGTPKRKAFIDAEGALDIAYEQNARWCMTKQTWNAMLNETDTAGQPIARVNEGIPGKYSRTLLGREVVLCNYLPTYSTSLTTGEVWAFLFDFSDYVLNTNYNINVQRYQEIWVGDDWVTRAVMIADGKVVNTNSLVTLVK